jgi:hypothetical protein
MKLSEVELPIVNKGWNQSHSFQRRTLLSEEFLKAWELVTTAMHPSCKSPMNSLAWMLEALLQITNQTVPEKFSSSSFREYDFRFKQLLGAIYSPFFYHGLEGSRNKLSTTLMAARKKLSEIFGVPITWCLPINTRRISSDIMSLVDLVNSMDVDPVKVKIWSGWVCRRKGSISTIIYVPLTPIYEKLGESFTLAFYELCVSYALSRRGERIHAARALSNYVRDSSVSISAGALKDSNYAASFFCDLYESFIRNGYEDGRGSKVSTLVTLWRGGISYFFEEFVFPSGLIARPVAGLPMPRRIKEDSTNVVDTSSGLIHAKLLTAIPLEVSDEEAMDIIFGRIKKDLNCAKSWAWHEVQKSAEKLDRRLRLAKEGTVRQISPGVGVIGSTDWSHPDHMKNAAATFEYYGYPCYGLPLKLSTQLFPAPRTRWAEEMAVPTPMVILAHCAVIVGEHPCVTVGFLEELALFDVGGKLTGVAYTDAGTFLIGAKFRRGAELARQEVLLNDRSAFAVEQIQKLTNPLRAYLRERGDGNWRYLLLATHKGFGYPRRMTSLSQRTSAPDAISALQVSFQRVLGMSVDEAVAFADSFSLTAIRASAAAVVYIESKSVQKMASALGHAKYDIKLLERYLPRAIRQFFEDRWIRIFQTGIIVQALKGSKFQLAASGFASIRELDMFLRENAIKMPADRSSPAEAKNDPWSIGSLVGPKEVIVGLNEEILTTLLSLDLARATGNRPLAPLAQYWADFGQEIIQYVEVAGSGRPDILRYLQRARVNAAPHLVKNIAYAA